MENLEQLKSILRQLEGVYKSSVDPKQKERVKADIERLKSKIKDLEEFGEESILDTDQKEEEEVVETVEKSEEEKEYKILSRFPVEKVHPESNEFEVNAAITYINVFENEFWGALSDFHLKLDYFHSRERDKFYNKLETVKRYIREYMNILGEFKETLNPTYREKLQLMKNKHARALLIDSVKFIRGIEEFLTRLIADAEEGGNIIMNPDDVIRFSKIEGNKVLNNWKILDALKFIRDFCNEFLDVIHLPDEMLKGE